MNKSNIVLWDLQIEAIDGFLKHNAKSYLMQLETGLGKTEIAIDIIKKYNLENKRVIFFTHKLELRDQTHKRFKNNGIDCGFIASEKKFEPNKLCYVAMIQTASARQEKECLDINIGSIKKEILGDIDLMIFDECHRIDADMWTEIQTQLFKDNKSIRCLGLSATPIGSNGGGLYKNFEYLKQGMYLHEAIKQGYLCKYKLFAPSDNIDYGVECKENRKKDNILQDAKSDFTISDIKKIDATFDRLRVYGNAVDEWERLAKNKKTLVFALSVNAAVKLSKEFNEKGYDFRVFHSNMDKSDRIKWLDDFKNGVFFGIVNVGIFLEGTDCPDIECIIDVAPTRQLRVQRQKIGRGLRISPNKEYLIIIDLANNSYFHGLPDDEINYSLQGFNIPNRKNSSGKSIHPSYIKCSDCSLIFSKKEPACPSCGAFHNNGAIPEELPRDIEERINNERQERLKKEQERVAKKTHFKDLWDNLRVHNKEKLERNNKIYYLPQDNKLLYVKKFLWKDMQEVLQEVVLTYGWQEMNLKLESGCGSFCNPDFDNLVNEHYLDNISRQTFKECFRIVLMNSICAWVYDYDRFLKQSLLANEEIN